MAERRSYVVYAVFGARLVRDDAIRKQIEQKRKTDWGGHADEVESSTIMAIRPDLVKLERAGKEDGRPRKHLQDLIGAETAMWWYADFPEHYAGDGAPANAELGELALEGSAEGLVEILRSVKRDEVAPRLQAEFFAKAENPLAGRPPRQRQR